MTSTSWDGNSEGVGALKQKCPPSGEGYGYLLEPHHIKVFSRRGWPVHKFAVELWWWYEKGPTATAPWRACSQVTGGRRILPYTGYNRYLPL